MPPTPPLRYRPVGTASPAAPWSAVPTGLRCARSAGGRLLTARYALAPTGPCYRSPAGSLTYLSFAQNPACLRRFNGKEATPLGNLLKIIFITGV